MGTFVLHSMCYPDFVPPLPYARSTQFGECITIYYWCCSVFQCNSKPCDEERASNLAVLVFKGAASLLAITKLTVLLVRVTSSLPYTRSLIVHTFNRQQVMGPAPRQFSLHAPFYFPFLYSIHRCSVRLRETLSQYQLGASAMMMDQMVALPRFGGPQDSFLYWSMPVKKNSEVKRVWHVL